MTLRHGCSPLNQLHIFRTPFPKNTTGGLLLNMTSNIFTVIDSMDFHFNKLASKNDTFGSKNQVLLPFPYDGEELPTEEAISAIISFATITGTNDARIYNKVVNDTNSVLILSITITTTTYNRANNENTNNNIVNDSNKLLRLSNITLTSINSKQCEYKQFSKRYQQQLDIIKY